MNPPARDRDRDRPRAPSTRFSELSPPKGPTTAAPVNAAVSIRPAEVCQWLLASVEVAEGRRKRRARNTTPDNIGLDLKLIVLRDCMSVDPDPDRFEEWLLERSLRPGEASGPLQAICSDVLFEWQAAVDGPNYRQWLLSASSEEDG